VDTSMEERNCGFLPGKIEVEFWKATYVDVPTSGPAGHMFSRLLVFFPTHGMCLNTLDTV